jgi:hypothetical protein
VNQGRHVVCGGRRGLRLSGVDKRGLRSSGERLVSEIQACLLEVVIHYDPCVVVVVVVVVVAVFGALFFPCAGFLVYLPASLYSVLRWT